MTEAEVVRIMRERLEGLSPKVYSNCQRRFATLREYLLTTEHVGPAMAHDVEMGDWNPCGPSGRRLTPTAAAAPRWR
ncbi:MAG TPA: hypothetical protein VNZ64_17400 [Candidatus Acidoferrum sp.]|nr:hypothetical protein [Candidatus Acidoferrum sp.]